MPSLPRRDALGGPFPRGLGAGDAWLWRLREGLARRRAAFPAVPQQSVETLQGFRGRPRVGRKLGMQPLQGEGLPAVGPGGGRLLRLDEPPQLEQR